MANLFKEAALRRIVPYIERVMRCASELDAPTAPLHLSEVERKHLLDILAVAESRGQFTNGARSYLHSVVTKWDEWTPFARQVAYSVLVVCGQANA